MPFQQISSAFIIVFIVSKSGLSRCTGGMAGWYRLFICVFANVFPRNESSQTIMKRFEFRELLRDNLHVAVYEALKEVTTDQYARIFQVHWLYQYSE